MTFKLSVSMRTLSVLNVAVIIFFLLSCKSQQSPTTEERKQDNSPDMHRLDWFREAKFGMFIHWGPYSCLAGEWNGRQVPVGRNAEWIMKELKIPVAEYRKAAHEMNPVKFDAEQLVDLAKSAGMKYIVITAKHHDGFAMYHSKVTDYNIFDWTPFKRDPLKELAKACAGKGIRFCVYYSHREDWDHPGGYGNNWDYDNDWGSDIYNREKFGKYLEEKAKPQLKELLTEYGPLGLVWFDRGMYTPEQGKEFADLVHSLQPNTLINGRVGHYDQEFLGDYQSMSDNGMPPGGLEEYWETPMTLNRTWGYSKFDTRWKSPETVIQRLVEIASRGGNYLLNIGPKGDGEIPEETVKIFNSVGPWIRRNAESIYGTSASPFGELKWGYCTIRDNKVYLFIRDWPQDRKLTVSGLRNEVRSAYFLAAGSEKIIMTKNENDLIISLPSAPPDFPFSVVVLETDGSPQVDPPVVNQDDKGRAELNYLTVTTYGKTVTRFNRKGGFHISKWTGPEDYAEWRINIARPGNYRINISYAANKEWEGTPFEIAVGKALIKRSVMPTGGWYDYKEFPAGYVEFSEAGIYKLTIKPELNGNMYLLYLRSITLEPVDNIKKSGWTAE